MMHGSVFYDEEFHFHDGESGEKLFVVLGTAGLVTVAAKTTSQGGRHSNNFGCQPQDRFHNFFLPKGSCFLKKQTWVCLDELYELDVKATLKKRFVGIIKPVCTLDNLIKDIQECALLSPDISDAQEKIIRSCKQ